MNFAKNASKPQKGTVPQDLPLFKNGKKNKKFEYFSANFYESHFYV